MMADLDHDTFDADILILWESSRGSLRMGEWVDLVDVCKLRETSAASGPCRHDARVREHAGRRTGIVGVRALASGGGRGIASPV